MGSDCDCATGSLCAHPAKASVAMTASTSGRFVNSIEFLIVVPLNVGDKTAH
jgi:hypothetical protein